MVRVDVRELDVNEVGDHALRGLAVRAKQAVDAVDDLVAQGLETRDFLRAGNSNYVTCGCADK